MKDELSLHDVESEGATALPRKEVMSLLDLNVDANLGLDLAAPVDLAAAANLNVGAPIDAAASANVLSVDSHAGALAHQNAVLDQSNAATADANAPQHATLNQSSAAPTGAAPAPAATTSGSPASLLSGGSLLNVNANIDANAHIAAPIDGAVAANANVAAPIDAAVGANVGSVGSTATALADQTALVHQNLDGATAAATAAQNANLSQ
ncbi:MAG: hypothetical protein NVS3B26_23700 [Mycobacteriales bacterium]